MVRVHMDCATTKHMYTPDADQMKLAICLALQGHVEFYGWDFMLLYQRTLVISPIDC